MSVTSEFFPRAIKYLDGAIDRDNKNEKDEALRLYLLSFEYFISGLKCKETKLIVDKELYYHHSLVLQMELIIHSQ